jgi:hypothetical protein
MIEPNHERCGNDYKEHAPPPLGGESSMDITVTASAKKGEWALTDLLGRDMGRVAETEPGIFRIKPQGQAVTTMAALTSKNYASLDVALAAIEELTRGVCRRE